MAGQANTFAPCSCGVQDCPELCWPHEWDPIAAGDSCLVIPPPTGSVSILEDDGSLTPVFVGNLMTGGDMPHRVREPYMRWGSGYACVDCVEVYGG